MGDEDPVKHDWTYEFWDVDTKRVVLSIWNAEDWNWRDAQLGGYDIVEVRTPGIISWPDQVLRRIWVKAVPLPEKGPDRFFFDKYGNRHPGHKCPPEMYETDWERHRAKFDENGKLKPGETV